MSKRQMEKHKGDRTFTIRGGDTAVLLIHGFSAGPEQMRFCGEFLAEKGYTVRAMCLPGHGGTLEELVRDGNWSSWLSAARREALHLMEEHKKLVVLGHSMGGALALLLGEELPVDGVIAVAPAVKVANRWAPLAPFLAPFLPRNFTTSGGMPIRLVGDVMTLGRLARGQLDRLRCPLLVVQSEREHTVTHDGPDIILKESDNCFDKESVWLDSSQHNCIEKECFPLFSKKVEDFMKMVDALDPIE